MVSLAALVVASSMVVGQAEGATLAVPKEVLSEFEFFVGKWEARVTHGEDNWVARYESVWAPNKVSVSYTYTTMTPRGSATFSGLIGWDAASKEIIFAEFGSSGDAGIFRGSITEPGKLMKGEFTARDPRSGRRATGKWRFDRKGPRETTFTATDFKNEAGEKLPDIVVHFVRK